MNCRGCRQKFLPLPDLSRKIEGDCSQGRLFQIATTFSLTICYTVTWTPIWPPETNRNICFRVFLLMRESFA